jgi:hypothetical protein
MRANALPTEETVRRSGVRSAGTFAEPNSQQEVLVIDARAQMTPAQLVERKLLRLMKAAPMPVSHLQTAARLHHR